MTFIAQSPLADMLHTNTEWN